MERCQGKQKPVFEPGKELPHTYVLSQRVALRTASTICA